MTIIVDTGPLLAAVNRRDEAHRLAVELLSAAGRDAVVPDPVAVEVDWLLRDRVGGDAARAFLKALAEGVHERCALSTTLFVRAVELDQRFAALGLGLTDASVMALAESRKAPILTFDFAHFRATAPERGAWRLVIDEADYQTWRDKR